MLLRLGNAVLDQGGGHVNDSVLVWDDTDTQVLLNLQFNSNRVRYDIVAQRL